jgi:hypothetical protein
VSTEVYGFPTELDDGDVEETTVRPIVAAPGDSILDAVRKRREALEHDRHLDLELPGYHGCLVLRCGPINAKKLSQVRERVTRQGAGAALDFAFNADIVIDSCREVLGRRRPEDELEPIDPEGTPVRVDARLAELLGVDAKTARDLLLVLYGGAPSPEVAVERAQIELYQWSSGMEPELEEDLLGES